MHTRRPFPGGRGRCHHRCACQSRGSRRRARVARVQRGSVRGAPCLLEERPETLELCVAVDSHRSAATERADYLLPCCAVLEHDELPSFDPGPLPLVSVQKQVLEPACPTVRPVSEIVIELAHACGIGQFFEFSPDEVYAARLRSVGLAETELAHASFAPLFDKQATYGDLPNIVFSNEALEEAGMPSPHSGSSRSPIPPTTYARSG